MKKRTSSKKYFFIFAIAFTVCLMLYVGSYWYLRNKTIRMEKIIIEEASKGFIHIPSGYYLEIKYGIGLSTGNKSPQGANVYPTWVDSKSKGHFVKWLGYLYYPLWKLEIALWRMKTFGE